MFERDFFPDPDRAVALCRVRGQETSRTGGIGTYGDCRRKSGGLFALRRCEKMVILYSGNLKI